MVLLDVVLSPEENARLQKVFSNHFLSMKALMSFVYTEFGIKKKRLPESCAVERTHSNNTKN